MNKHVTLQPPELDALAMACDNQPLAVERQGASAVVAIAYDAAIPFRLTLVTRANGLVDVKREELSPTGEWCAETTEEEDRAPEFREGRESDLANPEILEAAGIAVGAGENPDPDDDPLGHLPNLDELQ